MDFEKRKSRLIYNKNKSKLFDISYNSKKKDYSVYTKRPGKQSMSIDFTQRGMPQQTHFSSYQVEPTLREQSIGDTQPRVNLPEQ